MFGRNNGDAARLAKKLSGSVNESNRRGTPADADPSKAAARVTGNLPRSVAKAAKRGKGKSQD